MKKLLFILLAALLLTGCGENTTNISNNDTVLFESTKTKFTASDLYNAMKKQDTASPIILNAMEKIAEYEEIDTTEIDKTVEDSVKEAKEQGYESYIEYYYGSMDYYVTQERFNGILSELAKKNVNEKFDEIVSDSLPYKAEVAYFDSEESAKAALDESKNGSKTFAEAASDNGYQQTVEAKVYTDVSDLPVEVKETILSKQDTGLTDIIKSSTIATDNEGNSTITPRYYIVNLITKDINSFKDEFVDYYVANELDSQAMISEYLNKYNLEVHDQDVYEKLKENYGDFR